MNDFLQLCFAGLALGSRYALVAVGFVIIYKATGVINFAQGSMVTLGAYLETSALREFAAFAAPAARPKRPPPWGLTAPAPPGVLFAAALLAGLSVRPVEGFI